jgi:hypothetical protein
MSVAIVSTAAEAGSIPLMIKEPSGVERKSWPVTSGVPLPEGVLKDPSCIRLLSDGEELPLQTEVLSYWPDGSVNWLLLDFQVDLDANSQRRLKLEYGSDVKRSPVGNPVQVQSDADTTTISTGALKMRLSHSQFRLFDSVWLETDGEKKLTAETGSGIALTDPEGNVFRSDGSKAEVKVEQSGPLRACVRIEGSHARSGNDMFRYIVRVHAFSGQPYLRVFYTFINDWPNELMARVKSISLDLELSGEKDKPLKYVLGMEDGKSEGVSGTEGVRLFQVDDLAYKVNGNEAGKRAPGWIDVSTEDFGITVAVRDFWQNYPKALSARDRTLSVEICPAFEKGTYNGKPLEEDNKLYYYLHDGVYTFKTGLARTHEMWFLFHRAQESNAEDFYKASREPLLATCDPAYISATKVLGDFPPADPQRYFGYDSAVEKAMESHLNRQEESREYGMLNLGDWYGERRVNWGNLEYDLQHGLFLQYARTGERKYYLRAEQAARHHIDVDVVHAVNEHLKNPWGPPPIVGDIWLHCLNHTGGYYQHGEVDLPVSNTYFMGHSTNWGHVWVGGDAEYYLFSGDRRALEVSLEIADAMASHCPIGYGSGTHIRAQGWPMILLLDAYDLTLEDKYLKAAGTLWEVLKEKLDPEKGWVVRLAGDHCRHGDRRCFGNVPFMEGLMLCGLARYHRVTGDPEALRAITIGIDQMIRECWEEEQKTFRYTACPLSSKNAHILFPLSAEAMAYEIEHTGNQEHLRIFREGMEAVIQRGIPGGGKGFAQVIYFAPLGLSTLE